MILEQSFDLMEHPFAFIYFDFYAYYHNGMNSEDFVFQEWGSISWICSWKLLMHFLVMVCFAGYVSLEFVLLLD